MGDNTLARPQYKFEYIEQNSQTYYTNQRKYASNVRPAVTRHKNTVRKKANPLAIVFQLLFAALFVMYIAPAYMDKVTRPVFLRASKYPEIKVSADALLCPTSAYLYNSHFLGTNFLQETETKKPQMQALYETYHLTNLSSLL